MKYSQLVKNLGEGRIPPLTLLVGEEEYLAREAVDHFVRILVPPESRSFNLEILDAGEAGADRIRDALGTLPFLGGRRLVIIRNFENFKERENESILARYFEKPDPSIIVVLTAVSLEKKKKLKALLEKYADVVEVKALKADETKAWLSKKAMALGKSIDADALNHLIHCVGTKMEFLHNELEKAVAYVGERKRITREDLKDLVGDLHTESIFALTDGVGEKNVEKALKALKNIMAHGSDPLPILGMLARQFRLIWQAKWLGEKNTPPPQIAAAIGVSPYFVRGLVQQAKKFSEGELRTAFEKMKELDKKLKSTDTSSEVLLEKLLFDFCKPSLRTEDR